MADTLGASGGLCVQVGAGPGCDGRVLVIHDLLGISQGHVPRHVRKHAGLGTAITTAAAQFRDEVRSGAFPGPEQTFQ